MNRVIQLLPLFAAAGILFMGNGLLLTLIALRSGAEGFGPTTVGAIGTCYFIGFLGGSRFSPRLIDLVGHVRVFAALAALGAVAVLLHILIIEPYVWMAIRVVSGFCIAGLFTTIESWLNGATANRDRGRVLSIYSLVDLAAVTASQLMLPVLGIKGFEVFCVTAMLFSLALVPIALSPTATPQPQEPVRFSLADAWRISPLAFMTCFAIGLTNSSYRAIGPLYGTAIGLDLQGVAFFITAGIVGGAILQMPFGWVSDRVDRRKVLLFAGTGATIASLYVTTLAGGIYEKNALGTVIRTATDPSWYYFGSFLFGCFSMPLYSLAAAHANDHAKPNQYAVLSAGLLFTFGIAASVGPLASAWLMTQFGPQALFWFIASAHGTLVLATFYRMNARPRAAAADRGRFTVLPRTTPAIFRLAKRRLTGQGTGAAREANDDADAG